MASVKRVAVSATSSGWSRALRNYARDHATGVEIETLLDPRQLTRTDGTGFHVLMVDDVARVFTPSSVAAAQAGGTFVIGLCDQSRGLGRGYLDHLGVQLVLPDSTRPEELLETIARLAPDSVAVSAEGGDRSPKASSRGPGGRLSIWYSASGGCGLTEALVATAEILARDARAVVIEADALAGVLAARLNRSPSSGLAWCLNRVAQGRACLPDGLSGPAEEGGGGPVGRFDVVCQTGLPGTVSPVEAGLVDALLDEALAAYDHVLLAVGPLTNGSPSAARDRLGLGRVALGRADVALAWASADPLGAVALGGWRAGAEEAGLIGQAWAVFGRSSRSRFEEQQLADLVGVATATHQFRRLTFLPEDEAVRRARWDGTLVGRGRWLDGVRRLAEDLKATPAVGRGESRARSWGLVMAR